MARHALAAAGLELQVLLAREGAEGARMQTGAPLAAPVDMQALPVAGHLTGERGARGQAEEQQGREGRANKSSNHSTHLHRPRSVSPLASDTNAGRPLMGAPCRDPPGGRATSIRTPSWAVCPVRARCAA